MNRMASDPDTAYFWPVLAEPPIRRQVTFSPSNHCALVRFPARLGTRNSTVVQGNEYLVVLSNDLAGARQ
jgi:hypothetical protein